MERALRQLEGVQEVRVDVVTGRVRVRHAGTPLARGDIADAISRLGYRVEKRRRRRPFPTAEMPDRGENAEVRGAKVGRFSGFGARRGRVAITGAAGVLFGIGVAVEWRGGSPALTLAALALSTLAGGWYVVPRGVRAVMHRSLDMNFLMAVAAIGAWIIGEPTEAAATLFLFAVAELLESFSMDRARNAITALMDLSPVDARVRRGADEVRVPVAEVEVGEIVVVRPGEKLPVDGLVLDGWSSVNQAPVTGESMPADKAPGSDVFAGSLNGQGLLEIRSTRRANDTTVARIIHAVEVAQASRAPSQSFVERFARIYTPAVVVVALAVATLPPLLVGGVWTTWVYRALALLVVACPCALVISTPVTIVSGLAGAARAGVLIKGGAHLERTGQVTTIAIDKTGTLTRGEPEVVEVVSLRGTPEAEILRLALGVERHSEHPLARAVIAAGSKRGVALPRSSGFAAIVGGGARASVEGRVVHVANERLAGALHLLGLEAEATLRLQEQQGRTAVVVIDELTPVGVLGIADQPRAEGRAALDMLRHLGIQRVLMLTGDNEGTARAVARQLGIEEVHAGLLPDDKARLVRALTAGGERVAFVGDGINDAPALAAATVGVAMGAAGTDVALETADVALMGDDLTKLATAVQLSRKTLGIVRQNIGAALSLKAVFVVLALAGWATLWMAVVADMGTSLAVVINGLRALQVRAAATGRSGTFGDTRGRGAHQGR